MSTPQPVRLTDVRPEPINWLWPGRIPAGKLTLLDGDPSLGKSMITLDLAARLSTGRPLPDATGGGPVVRTLLLQAEDGVTDTLHPRLAAAGADFEHVLVFVRADGQPIRLPRDLPALEKWMREERIGLVVIDPLIAFLSRRVPVATDQIIRRLLIRLTAIAASTGAAIVIIRHLNKRTGEKALYRGGGSIGIMASARAGLLVTRDPDDPGRCVLTATKANLGPPPAGLRYRIVGDGVGTIEWLGPVALTADEALHPPRVDDETTLPGVIEATDWLLKFLKAGPRRATDVLTAARVAGISERTLERAKKEAEVESSLRVDPATEERFWKWRLKKPYVSPLPPLEPLAGWPREEPEKEWGD
jgi:hypothetical protein